MQLADRGSDHSALDLELYDQNAAHIYMYAYRLVSHAQDAEDITLEVFLAAYKSRKQLAGLDAQKQLAWLQRVAHNKVVDLYRRNSRVMLLPLEHIEKQRDDELSPEQHVIQQESYARLHRALNALPYLQQQIIRLRFVEGMSSREIARIVNKSESHVRTLVSRTLRRLRNLYEQK